MERCRKVTACLVLAACVAAAAEHPVFALNDRESRVKSVASYAMGVMFDLYGRTDDAIAAFQTASSHQDGYAIRLRLGADYARLGRLSEAVVNLRKALEFDPENVQARYLLALIYSI